MLIPYEYRGFSVEAFYDEPKPDGSCPVSVYIEAPDGKFCQQVASGVANWNEAKAQAVKAIDELIATTANS